MDLHVLRKELKPLGFTVRTKVFSFGRYATFRHVETGEDLTFNVFTSDQLERWQPLFDWGRQNPEY